MLNYVRRGGYIDRVVTSTDGINGNGVINSGDVVLIGSLVTVATCSATYVAGAASTLSCATEGVYKLPKATTTGSAIAQGTEVYWDATNKVVTATSSGNTLAGKVWASNLDGDATVQVRLAQG